LAQYYPSLRALDILIADFGDGVLKSYSRTNNFSPQTDEDAIRFALEGKSSKDERETRGFGIETIREKIMNRDTIGRFLIWSGTSIYTEMKNFNKNNMINLKKDISFKGCIVFIRLRC
jgi:hypothetical protein